MSDQTTPNARAGTTVAGLTPLGIVYGDLGTSPLYTMQTILSAVGPAALTNSFRMALNLINGADVEHNVHPRQRSAISVRT